MEVWNWQNHLLSSVVLLCMYIIWFGDGSQFGAALQKSYHRSTHCTDIQNISYVMQTIKCNLRIVCQILALYTWFLGTSFHINSVEWPTAQPVLPWSYTLIGNAICPCVYVRVHTQMCSWLQRTCQFHTLWKAFCFTKFLHHIFGIIISFHGINEKCIKFWLGSLKVKNPQRDVDERMV
jgi:hypothetical protein